VTNVARRREWSRLVRLSLLALPLLVGLAGDLQAQRRGGFSRGRATSVRQSRSVKRSAPRPADTRPASTPRDGRAPSPTPPGQHRQSTSVRQSKTAIATAPARAVLASSERSKRGDRLKDIPGRTKLYVNRKRFWYRRGRFYRMVYVSGAAYYEDVEAPVGAMVNEIPDDCEEVEIDGLHYFDCIDLWFREVTENGRVRYMVVEPPA
jgi:hypothetical protein